MTDDGPCFEHGATSKRQCRRCQELGGLTPNRDVTTGDPNSGPCLTHGAPNKKTCLACANQNRPVQPPEDIDLPWRRWPSSDSPDTNDEDERSRERQRQQDVWNERKRQSRNRRSHTPRDTSTHAYQPGLFGRCKVCGQKH